MAFGRPEEESTLSNDVPQDPRKRLQGTCGDNQHGIHETVTQRVLIVQNVALLKRAGIPSGAGIDINTAKKLSNGSEARTMWEEMTGLRASTRLLAKPGEMIMDLGGRLPPYHSIGISSEIHATPTISLRREVKPTMARTAESEELLFLVQRLGQNLVCTKVVRARVSTPFDQNTNLREDGREGSAGRESPIDFGSKKYAERSWSKVSPRSGDGHKSPQDYGDSKWRRKEKNGDGEEIKAFVRKGTVQPYMKVPLSIPYTTAGSEFLYGTHVVKAALQSGRRKLYKLYIYQGSNSQGEEVEQDNSIYKLALAAGVAVSRVRGDWERLLNKMSEQRPHNGYVLEASPVPKLPVTALEKVEGPAEGFDVQLGHQSVEELAINSTFNIHGSLATLQNVGRTQRYPFILMLDRIRDPGNLGSIIRSAYFLGVEAVIMIEHGTAPIGPVALKSSASAAEYLPLLMVKNEHAFMRQSQENGWKFFAATSPDSRSVSGSEPKTLESSTMNSALQEGPCGLLLGSEGEGIRPQLQRIVNGTVGIESARGSTQGLDSLNVGVAAALLMQEFLQGSKRAASIPEQLSEKGVLPSALEKVF